MPFAQFSTEQNIQDNLIFYHRDASGLAVNLVIQAIQASKAVKIYWINVSSVSGHRFDIELGSQDLIIMCCPAYGNAFANFGDKPLYVSIDSAAIELNTTQLAVGVHCIDICYEIVDYL